MKTDFVIKLLHAFIRSIMTSLLMNCGKPILLKMTKTIRKHHLWNAIKITRHRTEEFTVLTL